MCLLLFKLDPCMLPMSNRMQMSMKDSESVRWSIGWPGEALVLLLISIEALVSILSGHLSRH